MATQTYIALGSNLGDRAGHLAAAISALEALPGVLSVESAPVYETEPVGSPDLSGLRGEQDNFLNTVALVKTTLSAKDLLAACHRIEAGRGRDRASETARNMPRTLDLDIVLFGDDVIAEDGLVVPHPRMHQRWFVLKPLSDLSPDVVHPVLKKTAQQLLAELETVMPRQNPKTIY